MHRICPECHQLFEVEQRDQRRHPECQAVHDRVRERTRGTTAQRGLTGLHRRISEKYKREGRSCAICGHPPGDPNNPIQAGHIIPRYKGGQSVESNYAPMCWQCNRNWDPDL